MELLSKPDAISESSLLTKVYHSLGFQSERNFLIASGLFVLILLTTSNLFGILTTYIQQKISWGIAHKKTMKLLNTYQKKPYSYFLNHNTSDLRAYLISEVTGLTNGILIPIIEFFSRVIVCLTIFVLLLLVSPYVTLTMLLSLGGAYMIIFLARQNFLKRMGAERVKANVNRYKFLEEMLTGIKTIKIYGVNEYFYNRYEKASKQFNTIHPKVKMVYATPKYLLEILAFGGILGVTLYLFITTGDLAKSLPRLSFYALAGYRLLPSLQQAFSSAAKIKNSLPALDSLYDDLLESVDKDEVFKNDVLTLPFRDSIDIQNLSFRYENTLNDVVKNFNLTIRKGETVAFVGSTGSGKTTLIDLITGLLSPTEGQISVDDQMITISNVEEWQQNIAYVPQEVFLYDESIKANIALGIEEKDVDHDRLSEAMKMADIYDFVMTLPEKSETDIGERGVRLSGGQRQRLGLARALYASPTLLVLDEATSALDSITEKGIMDSINLLPDDLTIIIIAHRISTVKHADNIFLLENGFIINEGSYEDMVKGDNTFRTMVELS